MRSLLRSALSLVDEEPPAEAAEAPEEKAA
jgi:hypothetical protein